MNKVRDSVVKYEAAQLAANPKASVNAYVKVSPKGAGQDTYEEFHWVPKSLSEAKMLPESVRTFGSPWYFRQSAAQYRFGVTMHPMSGIGQFLVGDTGVFWLVAWNCTELLKSNIQVDKGFEYLTQLKTKQMLEFLAGSGVIHCLVKPGSAVWIPYGYQCVTVPMTQPSAVDYVVVPFCNIRLATETMTDYESTAFFDGLIKEYKAFLAAAQDKPWPSIGPLLVQWLEQVRNAVAVKHGISAPSGSALSSASGAGGSSAANSVAPSAASTAAGNSVDPNAAALQPVWTEDAALASAPEDELP